MRAGPEGVRGGGRFNLFDVIVLGFLAALVPVTYSSWLMFRLAQPQIHSVERSEITWAEEKIAAGLPIRLKVKIRGARLTPMLRAQIGTLPALGFTFEGPTSGDVIIGENVPAGTHDLVLFDGPVEVARAPGAITIPAQPAVAVRAIGAIVGLDEQAAHGLRVGQRFETAGVTVAEILALDAPRPDRREVSTGTGSVEVPSAAWQRDAILRVRCDASADARCHVSGRALAADPQTTIQVPGAAPPLHMRVSGVAPDAPPAPAILRVRVDGSADLLRAMVPGDRDVRRPALDDRAAIIEQVRPAGASALDVTVRLGVDRGAAGWRYHGQPIAAGEAFTLVTEKYTALGTILEMVVDGER